MKNEITKFFDSLNTLCIILVIILLLVAFCSDKALSATQVPQIVSDPSVTVKDTTCREILESARAAFLIMDSSLAQEALSSDKELKIAYKQRKSCLEQMNPGAVPELRKLSKLNLSAENKAQ
jgi:hypothetical protein